MKLPSFSLGRILVAALIVWTAPCLAQDQLPSWNDTAPKKAIVSFVERVTLQGSPDFIPPAERIATFDNDLGRTAALRATRVRGRPREGARAPAS
jgi:hypothetical protein